MLDVASAITDPGATAPALREMAGLFAPTRWELAAGVLAKALVAALLTIPAAQSIKSDDDPFAAATALRDPAAVWVSVDEAEAGRLYAAASEAAAAVSVEPTGQ